LIEKRIMVLGDWMIGNLFYGRPIKSLAAAR